MKRFLCLIFALLIVQAVLSGCAETIPVVSEADSSGISSPTESTVSVWGGPGEINQFNKGKPNLDIELPVKTYDEVPERLTIMDDDSLSISFTYYDENLLGTSKTITYMGKEITGVYVFSSALAVPYPIHHYDYFDEEGRFFFFTICPPDDDIVMLVPSFNFKTFRKLYSLDEALDKARSIIDEYTNADMSRFEEDLSVRKEPKYIKDDEWTEYRFTFAEKINGITTSSISVTLDAYGNLERFRWWRAHLGDTIIVPDWPEEIYRQAVYDKLELMSLLDPDIVSVENINIQRISLYYMHEKGVPSLEITTHFTEIYRDGTSKNKTRLLYILLNDPDTD